MSPLALVPNGVTAAGPDHVGSILATELSRRLIAVTALVLALLILATAWPQAAPAAPGTWSSVGNMTVPRHYHTATLLPDGTVLVAGGNAGSTNILYSSELFHPASGYWGSTYFNMAAARDAHTATLLPNGKVLVAGGESNTGPGGATNTIPYAELYNPATQSWQATAPMSTPRWGHTATLLPDGRVLVAGGYQGPTASAEIFDPAANSGAGAWSSTGAMITARAQHTATLLPNGKVLVAGGQGTDSLNLVSSSELFDPAANGGVGAWSSAGSNGTAREYHTATLLRDYGLAIVAGGWSKFFNDYLASVELYNVTSWQPSNPMGAKRAYHTATQLPNGQVLMAAGTNSTSPPYAPLQSAELYNAGTWSATGSMATARKIHTATLLPDGKVLVAGGYSNNGPTASAELYEPAPPQWVKLPLLLAFFPFDGNARDASDHGRNGVISGSPQLVTGYQGKAYSFNGTTDYITVPLDINFSNYPKLTMGAWAKPTAVGGLHPLLTHDNGGYDRQVGLDTRGLNNRGIGWSAFADSSPWGAVLGAVPAFQGKWTFVAVVYDQQAGTVRLQVDDMVLFTSYGATMGAGQTQLLIGGNPVWGDYFSGVIDNVFVFGDALNDQQLAYIRSRGAAAFWKPNPGLLLLLSSD